MISLHWKEQREQFGRVGGGQGLRRERREQEEVEIWKGVAERLMGWGGMEEEEGVLQLWVVGVG